MINTLRKIGIDGNYLNLIKSIYENHAANIFPGERLNAFSLRWEQGKNVHCHH